MVEVITLWCLGSVVIAPIVGRAMRRVAEDAGRAEKPRHNTAA